MPSPAFRFLEYVFLALLYLFFLRVVRAVWVELREPRLVEAGSELASASPAPTTTGLGAAPATNGSPHARRGQPVPLPEGARRRGQPAHITLVGGDGRGAVFDLAQELTIGRAPGCAVALADDTFVSQLHARVYFRDGCFWVEDLGSTNGTLLNGHKVTGSQVLHRGDRVQVGQSVLELQK